MFHIKSHQITEWPESKKVIILFYVKSNEGIHTFFIRNSCIRNLYWDGQITNKDSLLKPQRLKILVIFSCSYYNFEDTVTNLIKTCLEKNLSVVQTQTKFKVLLFVLNYKTVFSFAYSYKLAKMSTNC